MAKSDDDWFDDDTSSSLENREKNLDDDFFDDDDKSSKKKIDDLLDDDSDLDYDEDEDGKVRKKRVFKAFEDTNRVLQFEGMVIVLKRDSTGNPIELGLDIGQIKYPIVMDKMGQQLVKFCYNRLFIGAQFKMEGEEKFLLVKNFV